MIEFKFIPHVVKNLPASSKWPKAGVAVNEKVAGFWRLGPDKRHRSPFYPDSQLMHPRKTKVLSMEEQWALTMFHRNITGRDPPDSLEAKGSVRAPQTLWGRALAGKAYWNDGAYEVLGSKMTNSDVSTNRDDSHVRYMFKGDVESARRAPVKDTSYFGRVLFYLSYELEVHPNSNPTTSDTVWSDTESSGGEDSINASSTRQRRSALKGPTKTFFLAYIENMHVGYAMDSSLVYEIPVARGAPKRVCEFVALENVKELVGFISSRGKRFVVEKTSAFWPEDAIAYHEKKADAQVFSRGGKQAPMRKKSDAVATTTTQHKEDLAIRQHKANSTFEPQVFTIRGDGHCGFRTIAHAEYGDQNDFLRVRADLLRQLQSNPDGYVLDYQAIAFENTTVEDLATTISFTGPSAGEDFWFSSDIHMQLVADRYNVCVVSVTKGHQSITMRAPSILWKTQDRATIKARISDGSLRLAGMLYWMQKRHWDYIELNTEQLRQHVAQKGTLIPSRA